jgi:hypothetical protein
VLFACAIVAAVYNWSSVNPEILGSCSPLLRDSNYVDLPAGGGALDGLEMTRLLRDVEVEFGCVRGDGSGNAHLAATRLEDVLKVSKGGVYS